MFTTIRCTQTIISLRTNRKVNRSKMHELYLQIMWFIVSNARKIWTCQRFQLLTTILTYRRCNAGYKCWCSGFDFRFNKKEWKHIFANSLQTELTSNATAISTNSFPVKCYVGSASWSLLHVLQFSQYTKNVQGCFDGWAGEIKLNWFLVVYMVI